MELEDLAGNVAKCPVGEVSGTKAVKATRPKIGNIDGGQVAEILSMINLLFIYMKATKTIRSLGKMTFPGRKVEVRAKVEKSFPLISDVGKFVSKEAITCIASFSTLLPESQNCQV